MANVVRNMLGEEGKISPSTRTYYYKELMSGKPELIVMRSMQSIGLSTKAAKHLIHELLEKGPEGDYE